MEFISERIFGRFWFIFFWKSAYFKDFSDIAPSMKMLSTNLRVEYVYTVYQGSSDPPEKILNIFASENEVYAIFFIITIF